MYKLFALSCIFSLASLSNMTVLLDSPEYSMQADIVEHPGNPMSGDVYSYDGCNGQYTYGRRTLTITFPNCSYMDTEIDIGIIGFGKITRGQTVEVTFRVSQFGYSEMTGTIRKL